jgi:hypothetical protein
LVLLSVIWQDKLFLKRYGLIYEVYCDDVEPISQTRFWWTLVVLGRRAIIIGAIVGLSENGFHMKFMVASLLNLLVLLSQIIAQPFSTVNANHCEAASLSFLTCISSMLRKMEETNGCRPARRQNFPYPPSINLLAHHQHHINTAQTQCYEHISTSTHQHIDTSAIFSARLCMKNRSFRLEEKKKYLSLLEGISIFTHFSTDFLGPQNVIWFCFLWSDDPPQKHSFEEQKPQNLEKSGTFQFAFLDRFDIHSSWKIPLGKTIGFFPFDVQNLLFGA